jgi:hypothetical protein
MRRFGDKSFVRDQADHACEEGLAGTISSDDEADRRPTVSNAIDVANQRGCFPHAAHHDMRQAKARHYAR